MVSSTTRKVQINSVHLFVYVCVHARLCVVMHVRVHTGVCVSVCFCAFVHVPACGLWGIIQVCVGLHTMCLHEVIVDQQLWLLTTPQKTGLSLTEEYACVFQ